MVVERRPEQAAEVVEWRLPVPGRNGIFAGLARAMACCAENGQHGDQARHALHGSSIGADGLVDQGFHFPDRLRQAG